MKTRKHMAGLGFLALFAGVACSSPSCAGSPSEAATTKGKPHVQHTVVSRTLTLEDVDRLVWRPGLNATFAPTTIAERETLARLVPRLLEGARAATPPDPLAWQEDAARAGLVIERWQVDGQAYWALLELPEQPRGAGAYIFRVAPADAAADAAAEILLEAPHNYFDERTGQLGAQLFFFPPPGARPRAFFTNTIHRYQSAPGKKLKQKNSPADVAHNPEHGYSTATEAFARALGGRVLVIQLHGFAGQPGAGEDDEESAATPTEISMVVSAGDKQASSPRSAALAAALARAFGTGVKRYPEDVKVLGATTNVQGRLLRSVQGAEFVHIEMSAELRKSFTSDAAQRARLGTILFNTGAESR